LTSNITSVGGTKQNDKRNLITIYSYWNNFHFIKYTFSCYRLKIKDSFLQKILLFCLWQYMCLYAISSLATSVCNYIK
jgi:hypothetical protein